MMLAAFCSNWGSLVARYRSSRCGLRSASFHTLRINSLPTFITAAILRRLQ